MKFLYRLRPFLLVIGLHTIPFGMVYGYTVSNLKATVHSGQIFFTWTSPTKTNLQYNIYRSGSQITKSSQLSSSNLLGVVRDSSSQNIRKEKLESGTYCFVIPGSKAPLTTKQGLYVLTCTDTKKYYYSITCSNLLTGIEDKSILSGNTLNSSVAGSLQKPQPVLQAMDLQKNGDSIFEYVIWGDNQSNAYWPACNNMGSYAYNFTIQRNGNYKGQPLYVQFQDVNPFTQVTSFSSDLNVLQLDDWIPNGENTYWIGYNQKYNMYISSFQNPSFNSGNIKTYTLQRVIETIRFAKRLPGVDSTRIYMNGASHNGFGCMLTACMIPNEIACVYVTVPPILIKAEAGTSRVHQWSIPSVNLPTDVNYPGTSNPILMWDLCDLRTWYDAMDHLMGVPYAQGVNGRDDVTVGWVQNFHWYDTLNRAEQGGTWYWDQRDHSGDGSLFTNDETMPDYERYLTTRSYPAFSYCSVNQDAGNGNVNSGDPYGAINGYLDWNDNSISDEACEYDITCYVKDFYSGGALDPRQYDSCTTNITLRRLQNFHPADGDQLKWSIYNSGGKKIQHGNFTYQDGKLITLDGIKIYKSGSTVTVNISKCSDMVERQAAPVTPASGSVQLTRTEQGYRIEMSVPESQDAILRIYNTNGQLIAQNKLGLTPGENFYDVYESSGLYVLQIQSSDLRYGGKMVF